jgi:hypothetical protein
VTTTLRKQQQALDNDDPLNVPLLAALGPQAFTSVELKALALAEYGEPSGQAATSSTLTPYAGGGGAANSNNSRDTSAQEAAERRAQVACTSDNMEALEVLLQLIQRYSSVA